MQWFIFFSPRVITRESCLQGCTRLSFPKASDWHWKLLPHGWGSRCLALTQQVTQSFWICKQKSQEASWHCTFKSKEKKRKRKKKCFNTKISLHNTSSNSLCFPVSHAPPLIVLPCENVYSASHSSQPPHSLIQMPSKVLFSVSGF